MPWSYEGSSVSLDESVAVGPATASTPSSTATSRPTNAIVGEATGGDAMIPRVTEAQITPSAYATEEYCSLKTVGRQSGRPHTIEIWFAVDRDVVYMMAGGRDANASDDLVSWARSALPVALEITGVASNG
jgi:hypothetical protein